MNKDEFNNFKGIFKSHYINHKKSFNNFNVLIVSKTNGKVTVNIKLPSLFVMEKKKSAFRKIVYYKCGLRQCFESIDDCFFIDDLYDEINILCISDSKDITFYHHMNQPKSMQSRKLITKLLQNQSGDYTHKWLPNCFAYNYTPTDK